MSAYYAAGAMLTALHAFSHFDSDNPMRFVVSSSLHISTIILQMWKLRQRVVKYLVQCQAARKWRDYLNSDLTVPKPQALDFPPHSVLHALHSIGTLQSLMEHFSAQRVSILTTGHVAV